MGDVLIWMFIIFGSVVISAYLLYQVGLLLIITGFALFRLYRWIGILD